MGSPNFLVMFSGKRQSRTAYMRWNVLKSEGLIKCSLSIGDFSIPDSHSLQIVVNDVAGVKDARPARKLIFPEIKGTNLGAY